MKPYNNLRNNHRKPMHTNNRHSGRNFHNTSSGNQKSYNNDEVNESGSRIDARCRHHVSHLKQIIEKSLNNAREAIASDDRIMAEGYYQQADHYQRIVNERQPLIAKPEESAAEPLVELSSKPTVGVNHESRAVHPKSATSHAECAEPGTNSPQPTAEPMAPDASAPKRPRRPKPAATKNVEASASTDNSGA